MNIKLLKNMKKCSEETIKSTYGGNNGKQGVPRSSVSQCVFSFFHKC